MLVRNPRKRELRYEWLRNVEYYFSIRANIGEAFGPTCLPKMTIAQLSDASGLSYLLKHGFLHDARKRQTHVADARHAHILRTVEH